jgi:hypothetical protein
LRDVQHRTGFQMHPHTSPGAKNANQKMTLWLCHLRFRRCGPQATWGVRLSLDIWKT